LTPESIATLLHPYLQAAPPQDANWPQITAQLTLYLTLILKWNARTNLTAIRTPEEIVRRHFGESLFAGLHLGPCSTLLDFGSGAGFPGIPIQLLHPEISVTLAESQGKKAAFLREAVRTLGLDSEVWPDRVESMPPNRQFDTVALRAVDGMDEAVAEATLRARRKVVILTTLGSKSYPALKDSRLHTAEIPLPESQDGILLIAHRL
jgi:16S rRNA (guanine527-N7)-methyltransferase